MLKYLHTSLSGQNIRSVLVYYLYLNKRTVNISNKLVSYLENNYKLNIYYIIDELIRNLKVSNVGDDLVQIYILNKKIGNTTLEGLIQLVEYGNRDVPPSNCISLLFSKSLNQTREFIGGV